ncbi:MAG TPA: sodium:proton antiporter [Solirubrobacteraceae bacterium]|nr:sodium:proton antiporter [Solirubrobacteraceae bacterium]
MPSFEATAAFLGVLLIVGALASGLAQRSFLSLAALFVLAGFIVGDGGLEWVSFRARSGFVEDLAFVALIVILFRDGLEVEGEMLQRAWHLPLRKLAIAMPLTLGIVAVAAHSLVKLSWTESLLLGALLSPTDPVLTSNIVTNPRVPRIVRHSLNLESGLNDGLALPAVLTFLAALSSESSNFVWWRFVLQDVGLGFLYGLAIGYLASRLMPSDSRRPLEHAIPSHQKSLYALGIAFATYGATVLSPKGNGFIAVFVAAIVLGLRRPDLRRHFEQRADEIVEIVKLGIFVVFGSLLTLNALESSGWQALALVAATFLIARPVAVWIALLGTDTDAQTRLFMGWFGPKGVATMTFSLLVLDQHIAAGERIFDLTALVVFCSIVVHGLSDTPGANWIARHSERVRRRRPARQDSSV